MTLITLPWRDQRPVRSDGPLISSSLTEFEAKALIGLVMATTTKPPRVLEIGSAYGFSAITMALAGAEVTSVDHHSYFRSVKVMWRNVVAHGVNDRVKMIVAESKTALPEMADGSFDGAFVDGDHTFSGVTFDAEQCLRLVKPGGWIAFHDYKEATCHDVQPALDTKFNGAGRVLVDTLYVVEGKLCQ